MSRFYEPGAPMTVAILREQLRAFKDDDLIITNVWRCDGEETACGHVTLVARVDAGVALKGDEIS